LALWNEGVEVRDASEYTGSGLFQMHAFLFHCMHDFPAYGTLAGRFTSGFRACPICRPNTISRRSASLRKVVYRRQHRLPPQHPLKRDVALDGNEECAMPPPPITSGQVLEWDLEHEFFVAETREHPVRLDPKYRHGVKWRSILFELPYWVVSHA
jgi:hypothetical protein